MDRAQSSSSSSPRRVVCAALVKLGGPDSNTHPAWPPPPKVLTNIPDGVALSFVHGATAAEVVEAAARESPPEDPISALLWIPGAAGAEAAALIDRVPSIQWLHSFSAGVDGLAPHLAPPSTTGRPLATTNGRGAFSSSLAEYAVCAAMHFTKQLARVARNAADKRWDPFVMHTLRGKTMGFVGYGHIAKATARLARALGMRVVAVRRRTTVDDGDDDVVIPDATYSPPERLRLFEEADVIVCSLPGTGETRDFCGTAEFAAMKASGIFVSLGRGAAVDEGALCAALDAGTIGGAALDVFKQEPLPPESPLWRYGPDKLLLTAHNADLTADYFELGWQVWRDNLDAWLAAPEGAHVEWATPFDPSRGY